MALVRVLWTGLISYIYCCFYNLSIYYFFKIICLYINWRVKRALGEEVDGKLHIDSHAHMWYIYVPTFITRRVESAQKILRNRLKKGNDGLGRPTIGTLDLSMMKKSLPIQRSKESNIGLHVACLVNSCQGKDAGVLFRLLNSSTHWHWMGYKFLIVGTVFNLAKVNTVPCMCAATLSLSDSEQMAGQFSIHFKA